MVELSVDTESPIHEVNLIGGHNYTRTRPVFTQDSNEVLISTGSKIRVHSADDGALKTNIEIPLEHRHEDDEKIIMMQLHPREASRSLIAFTKFGRILIFNYRSRKLTEILDLNELCETVFGDRSAYVKRFYWGYYAAHGETNDHIYFAYNCETPYRIFSVSVNNLRNKMYDDCVVPLHSHLSLDNPTASISVGGGDTFVATIYRNRLRVCKIPMKATSNALTFGVLEPTVFKCVTAHPTKMILAVGDSIGRIFLYKDDFLSNKRTMKTILHWHNIGVNDLTFSPSANFLYSVGYETVLVRWDIQSTLEKSFLPRIGPALKFITTDVTGFKIIVTGYDNSIYIIEKDLKIICRIEGLALLPHEEFDKSKADIIWHWKSNTVLTRGNWGHLQFYCPFEQRQINKLCIVDANYIAQNLHNPMKVTTNVDLARFALSDDCRWLVTVEERDDGLSLAEMRMKFWLYEPEIDEWYAINTIIHLPHKKRVNEMRFSSDSSFLVTSSCDGTFKTWHLFDDSNEKVTRTKWISGRATSLNDVAIPRKLSISGDGSLIAVNYDSIVTFWEVKHKYYALHRETFLPIVDEYGKGLLQIAFCSGKLAKYFIEVRSNSIRMWDLLALTVEKTWTYESEIKLADFNQPENRLLIICSNTDIFVYDFNDNCRIHQLKSSMTVLLASLLIQCKIVSKSAAQPKNGDIVDNMMILFYTELQSLFGIGAENRQKLELNEVDNDPALMTPFARMLLDERMRIELEQENNNNQGNYDEFFADYVDSSKVVNEMFSVPSHVLPPIEKLCRTFLISLLQNKSKDESKTDETGFKMVTNESHDDDSDDETPSERTKLVENEKDAEEKLPEFENFVFVEDYQFLVNS